MLKETKAWTFKLLIAKIKVCLKHMENYKKLFSLNKKNINKNLQRKK